jgi:Lipoprotein confined to pathogenic Mycobacterium
VSGPVRRRLVALVLAGSLVGCAAPDPPPEDPVNVQARLAARPSMEQALAHYDEMQKAIRDQLDAAGDPLPWKVVREAGRGGCPRTFPGTEGIVTRMAPWGFDGSISDADWPRAAQIIAETTAEYGFETPTMTIDEPGRHRVTGADLELGATYELSAEAYTTMQVTTGCHLPAAAKG